MEIDKGEASAIALSFDIDESMLILDDYKARQVADKLNIKYTGTFGIILRAKKIGLIDSVKPILKKIKATNFRFSEELFEIVLREAKEI
jgi:predicted nucleic acid-binding protein